MKVLLIAQVVTWPPLLYAAAPSFAQNSGGLLDIFYLGFGALVFFGVSFVGLILGSVAQDLFEEFGQRPEKPYDEVHLESLGDDALLEEYKALKSELDDDRAIKDPWDRVLLRRIEAELGRRGLKDKPHAESREEAVKSGEGGANLF